MKKLLGICALIAVVGVFFTACPLDPDEKLSAKERVEAFIDDANEENWSSLKAHTHPEAEKHSQANTELWVTKLGSMIPLERTSISLNSIGIRGNHINYTAILEEDEPDNYKIRSIKRGEEVIFK